MKNRKVLQRIRELYAEYKSPYNDGWVKNACRDRLLEIHQEITRIINHIEGKNNE